MGCLEMATLPGMTFRSVLASKLTLRVARKQYLRNVGILLEWPSILALNFMTRITYGCVRTIHDRATS